MCSSDSSIRGLLSQAGYALDDVPDETIARSFLETVQQNQQQAQRISQIEQQLPAMQQMAQLGQQIYPHLKEFQEFMAAKQQANGQPAPVPPQQAAPMFKQKPEFHEEWMKFVTKDPETGRFIPVNQWVPLEIVQGVNAYNDWRASTADQMLQNIDQFTPEAIEKRAREAARAEWQQLQEQQHQQWQQQEVQRQQHEQLTYAKKAIDDLAPWVYEQHNGKTVIDPITGKPRVSQLGYVYANFVHQLEKDGITDTRAQDFYARQMLNAHIMASQQQAAQPQTASQATAPDKRQQFLQRSGAPQRRPQQNASALRAVASPAAPAQNDLLDFGAMLDQSLLQQTGRATR